MLARDTTAHVCWYIRFCYRGLTVGTHGGGESAALSLPMSAVKGELSVLMQKYRRAGGKSLVTLGG